MTDTLRQTDAVGQSLIRAYQRMGEFCVIVRTDPKGTFRYIGPQVDVTRASEFLRGIADALFDGTNIKTVE